MIIISQLGVHLCLAKLKRQLDYYGSCTTYYQDRLYVQFASPLLDLISTMVVLYMIKHTALHFIEYYLIQHSIDYNGRYKKGI